MKFTGRPHSQWWECPWENITQVTLSSLTKWFDSCVEWKRSSLLKSSKDAGITKVVTISIWYSPALPNTLLRPWMSMIFAKKAKNITMNEGSHR